MPRTGKDGALSAAGPWALLYKKAAYNWLPVFVEPPPAYGARGKPVEQTKMGALWFGDAALRDISLAVLAGKWGFAWWTVFGDDFDVTDGVLSSFPADARLLLSTVGDDLLASVAELKEEMLRHAVFKLNAGKRIGNYNLSACRHVTDRSDALLGKAWALDAGNALNVAYHSTIKTEQDSGDD